MKNPWMRFVERWMWENPDSAFDIVNMELTDRFDEMADEYIEFLEEELKKCSEQLKKYLPEGSEDCECTRKKT